MDMFDVIMNTAFCVLMIVGCIVWYFENKKRKAADGPT